MVRLAWEAAELAHEPAGQARHLVDGMARLVGGDFGFYCGLAHFRPDKVPHWVFAATGSVVCREIVEYLSRSAKDFSIFEDPIVDLGRGVGDVGTLRMTELLVGRDTARYRNGIDIMQREGFRDALVSLFRRPDDPDVITGLSVHRTAFARPFNAREKQAAHWLGCELRHLQQTGRLAPRADPFATLSPRLRQVAQMLLTAAPPKQIARSLKLTVSTLRDYTKHVYREMNVGSRAELMSRYGRDVRTPK